MSSQLTPHARKILAAIAADQVRGTYATVYRTSQDSIVAPIDGLHLGDFGWSAPKVEGDVYERHHIVTAAVARLIRDGYASVLPGEIEQLESGCRFMAGAPVVLTDAGREALGLEPAAEAPPAPKPGIHVTGLTAPANIRRGDVVAARSADGESVAWTVETTPRVNRDHTGFSFVGAAVCDGSGVPRNDRRVIDLDAYEIAELVEGIPDYRTGRAGAAVRDMRHADIGEVSGAGTLVYLTDLSETSLNGLVWEVQRCTESEFEGAPYLSVSLRSVCDLNGVIVASRSLDYGGPVGGRPVILCGGIGE